MREVVRYFYHIFDESETDKLIVKKYNEIIIK